MVCPQAHSMPALSTQVQSTRSGAASLVCRDNESSSQVPCSLMSGALAYTERTPRRRSTRSCSSTSHRTRRATSHAFLAVPRQGATRGPLPTADVTSLVATSKQLSFAKALLAHDAKGVKHSVARLGRALQYTSLYIPPQAHNGCCCVGPPTIVIACCTTIVRDPFANDQRASSPTHTVHAHRPARRAVGVDGINF